MRNLVAVQTQRVTAGGLQMLGGHLRGVSFQRGLFGKIGVQRAFYGGDGGPVAATCFELFGPGEIIYDGLGDARDFLRGKTHVTYVDPRKRTHLGANNRSPVCNRESGGGEFAPAR